MTESNDTSHTRFALIFRNGKLGGVRCGACGQKMYSGDRIENAAMMVGSHMRQVFEQQMLEAARLDMGESE